MSETAYRVDMQHIDKSFAGVHALSDVKLQIKPGEIHALMGENGAGKSTLIRILSGAYTKDAGTIAIDGQEVDISSPKDGIDNGVSVIYQEFALIGDVTVAENIFIDHLTGDGKIINWKALRKKAKDLLDELGFGMIDSAAIVNNLTIAYQQVIEIAKALSKNSKVLVLDEPTALLASSEVEQLFKLLLQLKSQGVSIIYVSHRLEEIFRISDRITVLKDGTYVDTVETGETSEKQLVSMMIGRDLENFFPERHATIGDAVFEVRDLNCGRMVQDVSFSAREGEVLGFGGLVGSGRTETMRAIFGEDRKESGSISYRGRELDIKSPSSAFKNRVGMLPEDRKHHGVLLDMPIRYNTTMSCIYSFTGPLGIINRKKEGEAVSTLGKQLNLKAASIDAPVKSLSGGNQQKVALSKLLCSDCDVFLFDEPTRGVDIGAKREIYALINALAEEGKTIIMVSSEMTEIIGMCDRALIMRNGRIVGELGKDELNEQNFINHSMGVSANDDEH